MVAIFPPSIIGINFFLATVAVNEIQKIPITGILFLFLLKRGSLVIFVIRVFYYVVRYRCSNPINKILQYFLAEKCTGLLSELFLYQISNLLVSQWCRIDPNPFFFFNQVLVFHFIQNPQQVTFGNSTMESERSLWWEVDPDIFR